MKKVILDKYEQEIESNIEFDVKTGVDKQRQIFLKQCVVNTSKKNKRINIRLSEFDLQHIKIRALEVGIPYQTLISSVIHKVATKQINV